MNTASSRRRLLPRPAERTVSVWWVFGVLAGAALLCWWSANRSALISVAIVTAFVLVSWAAVPVERRRLRRLAASRSGESICTFARSFNPRSVDLVVVRAVYEELQHECRSAVAAFPIRASDRFDTELRLDPDDLASTVAHRARRSLDHAGENPRYGHVHTVRDLVEFFTHQPPISSPASP